jgi:hypothetical protein
VADHDGAVLYFVAPYSFWILTIASIIASCGFGIMLNNLYNYSSATFPTRLRAVVTGWANGVGHAGLPDGPADPWRGRGHRAQLCPRDFLVPVAAS